MWRKPFTDSTLMSNSKEDAFSDESMMSAHVAADAIASTRALRCRSAGDSQAENHNASFSTIKKKCVEMEEKIRSLEANKVQMELRIRTLEKELKDALTQLKDAFVVPGLSDMLSN